MWKEDEEADDVGVEPTGKMVDLSEAGTAFLKMVFGSKFLNDNRELKTTKNGILDSHWIRRPRLMRW